MTPRTSEEIRAGLDGLQVLEPAARVLELEELLAAADSLADDPLVADIRVALLSAVEFSGRPTAELLPHFAWLVQRFDQRPAWWTSEHDRTVLWTYKWMITVCRDNHRIPLAVVHEMLDGMEERYRRHGEGLSPVYSARYQIASHVLGAAEADPSFRAWSGSPRTSLSDCEACEPAQRAQHLAALGHHGPALDHAWPVLRGDLTCMSEPQHMAAVALESMLVTGADEDAAYWHTWGARTSRANAYEAGSLAHHISVTARAGQLGRSLELLEEQVTTLVRPRSPRDALDLAVAGAVCLDRLLARGGDVPDVRAPDGARRPAAEVRDELTAVITEHATAFDARNGTDAVGLDGRARLAAPDLPHLPLGSTTGRSVDDVVAARTPAARSEGLPSDEVVDRDAPTPLTGLGLMELWQLHERAQRSGDIDTTEEIGAHWLTTHDTDQAWDALAVEAGAPERALAVIDLTKSALRAAVDPCPGYDLVRGRAVAFAGEASSDLEQVLLDQFAEVTPYSLLRAHRVDEQSGHPAPRLPDDPHGPALLALLRRADAAIATVDALVASGERVLDPDLGPRTSVRGRLTGLPLEDGRRAALVQEVLQLTEGVTATSDLGARWQRAAALLTQSLGERFGDATACREALALVGPDELAPLRVGCHTQLAMIAASQEQGAIALEHLEQAWLAVEPLGGPRALGLSFEATHRFLSVLDPQAALGLLERQLAAAVRVDRALAAAAGARIATLHNDAGSWLDAAETAERWIEVLRTVDSSRVVNVDHLRADLCEQAARASMALGETGRAVVVAGEARDFHTGQEAWARASELSQLVGRAHERAGDSVAAAAAYREAYASADHVLEQGSFTSVGASVHDRRSYAVMLLDADGLPASLAAFDAAAAHLAEVRALLEGAAPDDPRFGDLQREAMLRGMEWERLYLLLHRGNTLARAGDPTTALRVIDGLEDGFAAIDVWDDAVVTLHVRAGCLADLGERRAAGKAYQRAVKEAETHELPEIRRSIAASWARWLDGIGKEREAEKVWRTWGPPGQET